MKKCADDSETSNWISAHTKECSKCNSTIEKNGGCNHMSCKKCKYEVTLFADSYFSFAGFALDHGQNTELNSIIVTDLTKKRLWMHETLKQNPDKP
jgi:hypothetical protein